MYLCHFIHLFNRWLDVWVDATFWLLWVTLLWTWMLKWLWVSTFSWFGYIRRNRVAGWCSSSVFHFWKTTIVFPMTTTPFHNLTRNVQRSSILDILITPYLLLSLAVFFSSSHLNGQKGIYHCSFCSHFPNDEWCCLSFHVLIVNLCIFFIEISI